MKQVNYRTPAELKEKVGARRKELQRFVGQLKKQKPGNLDEITHKLHHDAFSGFDCTACANCCRTIGPRLIPGDIERLAKHCKMSVPDFYLKYIIADEDNDLIFAGEGCPFIMPNNLCSVYQWRPRACREYPHTDRKRFVQILDLTLKNCETCPVVFDIVNELKIHYKDLIR